MSDIISSHFHLYEAILFMLPLNSLAPGKLEWHFWYLILQIISMIDGWGISFELTLRLMSLDLTDEKSTLVQVMSWFRQATSHYLSQWWPSSLSPNGITRPQWVNSPMVISFVCRWFMNDIVACLISYLVSYLILSHILSCLISYLIFVFCICIRL